MCSKISSLFFEGEEWGRVRGFTGRFKEYKLLIIEVFVFFFFLNSGSSFIGNSVNSSFNFLK